MNPLQNSVVSSVRCDLSSLHVFLTLHECQVLHQRERNEYSICIWDTRRFTEPQVVLSCWENVTCIEKVGPIVIAGTASGALCLWDIEKTDEGNDHARILCVDRENAVTLIDMKSKTEIKLNERTASELRRYRLLGMTHNQAIMAENDQEIIFYDLRDHLGVP
ncbi:hypothetical protein pipiens_009004 [Culex pipiens pipiens]|uniref:Uncharacterized protein n=1 Tax=Culex pipiens pipiens TaxID=38569 RepID=A0ABD1DHB5_CULPP